MARALLQAQTNLVRAQIGEKQRPRDQDPRRPAHGHLRSPPALLSPAPSACSVPSQRATGHRPPEDHVRLRVGLNAGEAIRHRRRPLRPTVDAAARICAKATAARSSSPRPSAACWAPLETPAAGPRPLPPQGLPRALALIGIALGRRNRRPTAVAPVLAERTPYVGREDERAESGA